MHWKDQYQQPTSADNLIKVPLGCISVGVCIHMYIQESKNNNKIMSDFYNSLPMRMQDMKNLKGLLIRQLKDYFFSGLRKHNERLL